MYSSQYSQYRDPATNYSVQRNPDYEASGLRNQVLNLENLVVGLTNEKEKLSLDLRDSYTEIQQWKNRYDALERNSRASIQEYAEKLERQKQQEMGEIIAKANTKYNMGVSEVENQNRLMQSKLAEYESKIYQLSDEINRLTQVNMDKTVEVDQWKVKYATLEKDARAHVDDLKLSVEMRTRDEVDVIAREYNSRFLEERKNYEMQIKTIRQAVIDMETKLRLAAAETERYNTIIVEKDQEIDMLKGKFTNFERYKAQEIQDMIARFEEEKRDMIERELKSQALKFSDERSRYESRIKEINQVITDLENQMTYLSVELERLQTLVTEKTREVETLKQEYSRMEEFKNNEIRKAQQQFENLRKNALQEADMEVRYQAERSALEAEILQNRQKIAELENQVRSIEQDNDRLNARNDELYKEAGELKMRKGRPETIDGDIDVLKRENDKLKSFSLEASEIKVRFDVERQNYENQITQLKQIIQVNKAEIEKLYSLVNVRRQEFEHQSSQMNEARNEIVRMENTYKELESRYVILNSKYEQMIKEATNLQRSRDLLKGQIERGNMEIAQKNRELLEKIKEVDALKVKYEEALSGLRLDVRTESKARY